MFFRRMCSAAAAYRIVVHAETAVVAQHQGKSALGAVKERRVRIREVIFFRRARQKDDWKFQSFRLMDAHDFYRVHIGRFGFCAGERMLCVAFYGFNILQKFREISVCAAGKTLRRGQKFLRLARRSGLRPARTA